MIKINRGKLVPPMAGQTYVQAPPAPVPAQVECKHPALVSVGDKDICQVCKKVFD